MRKFTKHQFVRGTETLLHTESLPERKEAEENFRATRGQCGTFNFIPSHLPIKAMQKLPAAVNKKITDKHVHVGSLHAAEGINKTGYTKKLNST